MDFNKEELLNKAFKNIKLENGIKIMEITPNITDEDILTYFYYRPTINIVKDDDLIDECVKNYEMISNSVFCFKCDQKGHVSKDCPDNKHNTCQKCDLIHKRGECKFVLCYNCDLLGHHAAQCNQVRKKIKCDKCLINHDVRECPINWRYYHLKPDEIKPLKMSCPLCFATDHFMDDCNMADDLDRKSVV